MECDHRYAPRPGLLRADSNGNQVRCSVPSVDRLASEEDIDRLGPGQVSDGPG
jgi:hypothetical protein